MLGLDRLPNARDLFLILCTILANSLGTSFSRDFGLVQISLTSLWRLIPLVQVLGSRATSEVREFSHFSFLGISSQNHAFDLDRPLGLAHTVKTVEPVLAVILDFSLKCKARVCLAPL